jgi:hypothetical protein
MTKRKGSGEESGFGGVFKGLADLIEKLGDLAEKGEKLKFTSISKQLKSPIMIVADFECTLQKLDNDPTNGRTVETSGTSSSSSSSSSSSFVRKQHEHKVNSFACVTVQHCGCEQEKTRFEDFQLYHGYDSVEVFILHCHSIAEKYHATVDLPKPLVMSSSDWEKFQSAVTCYLCETNLPTLWDGSGLVNHALVHKDHCHFCGGYRGAACARCNINLKKTLDIPIVFHNLRRYDGHLIMQEIAGFAAKYKAKISCIAKGMEDYLSFSLKLKRKPPAVKTHRYHGRQSYFLKFIDSFQFLTSSLDKLVSSLKSNTSIPTEEVRQKKNKPFLLTLDIV